jgi:hypothetical protein
LRLADSVAVRYCCCSCEPCENGDSIPGASSLLLLDSDPILLTPLVLELVVRKHCVETESEGLGVVVVEIACSFSLQFSIPPQDCGCINSGVNDFEVWLWRIQGFGYGGDGDECLLWLKMS